MTTPIETISGQVDFMQAWMDKHIPEDIGRHQYLLGVGCITCTKDKADFQVGDRFYMIPRSHSPM